MILDQIINQLRYGGPEVRIRAAGEIALANDPQLAPFLIEALQDDEPDVIIALTRALNTYRDPRAVPYLLPLLQENNFTITEAAATTLGLIGDPVAVKPLLDLIDRARRFGPNILPQHQTIVQSVIALGRIKDQRATSIMIKLLRQGYKNSISDWQIQIRQAAALGLGFLDQPAGTTTLLESLRDDERTEVRQSVISALGMLRSQDSFQQMLSNLNFAPFEDQNRFFRRQQGIIIALGQRGDRAAVPYLLPLVKSRYPEIRVALSETLVQLGESERGEVLIPFLRDRNVAVRHAAAQALGQLGVQSAAGPLSAVLVDPDKRVAGAAQNALDNLKALPSGGGPTQFPSLPSANPNPDETPYG